MHNCASGFDSALRKIFWEEKQSRGRQKLNKDVSSLENSFRLNPQGDEEPEWQPTAVPAFSEVAEISYCLSVSVSHGFGMPCLVNGFQPQASSLWIQCDQRN